ncbi:MULTISPECIES: phosphate ABC transporter permease subunit PstC [unclassified Herbaspirillum]|nr:MULTISPECIES: phosphate ABC transporter permease subunit PstC [unclassified Herbaspirillum]RFB70037.1 phosphate ABC transporter permease subunit PstC [Herbaspirillum sp. 3R-3a1]TFI07597.1 phosphate ABC transporter permease subunit PstC [Herbaspirillum sp. 3R11]TFI13235.1 phosphate ABC transporter permease subunit PstC [Herbaspirillum sp. 3R-11]TFI28831.1 phosphate ABC transporter permease subunit PstC [Herbaspirillum sp. 3C11]TFI28832.1 phosphate ABC transporter permease subunit PstC [Herba
MSNTDLGKPPADSGAMQQAQHAHAALLATMRKQRIQDFLFHKVTLIFALSVLVMLGGIIVSLFIGAWPAFHEFGPGFITRVEWDPVNDQYGAAIAIVGTLTTSLIALLIAFPVSFGIALFLTEICPSRLRRPLGTAVELLAGVPSIIYGMWGLFVFAPLFAEYVQPALKATLGQLPVIGALFQGPTMGIGILTAGLILSVMIIPFIASVMRDVFEVVPAVLKESAYGLGCTRWEVVRKVVLPYTKTGVVGGVMLGLGRALGETMAVTFVIGNSHRLSWSLFAAGNSIASTLANEIAEASSTLHVSSLFALGLILFVITFIVLAVAKVMLMGMTRKEGAK